MKYLVPRLILWFERFLFERIINPERRDEEEIQYARLRRLQELRMMSEPLIVVQSAPARLFVEPRKRQLYELSDKL